MSAHQKEVCRRYGVEPAPLSPSSKVGIAINVRTGELPINGLRCNPAGDSCGWYIWAGEWSESEDFFKPLHVEHLKDWCADALPFLQLPPGWRFQVAPGHEDAWYDPELEL